MLDFLSRKVDQNINQQGCDPNGENKRDGKYENKCPVNSTG
jgi:hypothetical protein